MRCHFHAVEVLTSFRQATHKIARRQKEPHEQIAPTNDRPRPHVLRLAAGDGERDSQELGMNVKSIATAIANDLEANPSRWTQGAMARNAQGQSCGRQSATCLCLLGHIWNQCDPNLEGEHAVLENEVERAFQREVGSIARYNDADDRTVSEIIQLCRNVAAGAS
jgi:hypothetical protein